MAHRDPKVPTGSTYRRLRGGGGDGGVECYWQMPNGDEWGYQAKYFFKLNKKQLDDSVATALEVHPALKLYVICVPFDLTGPTGRAGKSETERWDDYVTDWKKQARDKGMEVEFVLWSRHTLLDHLLATSHSAARVRFWFGKEQLFEPDWFDSQIGASVASAGMRYSPQLDVDVPIAQFFEALANTEEWEGIARATVNAFEAAVRRWRRTFDRDVRTDDETPLSSSTKAIAVALSEHTTTLSDGLSGIIDGESTHHEIDVSDIANNAVRLCSELESACCADLDNRHGDKWADTPSWRQFMAEYMCCFPAQYIDAARDFLPELRKIKEWCAQPIVMLPNAKSMLVSGFAGSGKTHAFCDAACQRLKRGFPSVVLLGEQFGAGEPWDQIRRLMGLAESWSRDDILTALDASGEAADNICIIFIDALNEAFPRSLWKSHLPAMIESISDHPSLKLCVSCRTTYLGDTIPNGLDAVHAVHHGFKGVEDDACFRYFEHYGLDAPAMPLLQPEFSNPLFLRIVCDSLQRASISSLPHDLHGISKVVQLSIDSCNQVIAESLDYDPRDDHVGIAVRKLAKEMSDSNRAYLFRDTAKSIVDEIWPSQTRESSLFHHLIRHGALVEDYAIDDDDSAPVNTIRFAFDRVADHLRACALIENIDTQGLRKAFENNGALFNLVVDVDAICESRGVLTELSILIPEQFPGCELLDYAYDDESRLEFLGMTIEGLPWRPPSSLSYQTTTIVTDALQNGHTAGTTMEVLMSLSCRPNHRLNSDFVHDLFSRAPMANRDSFLCPFFYDQFEQEGSFSRLVNWALSKDVTAVPPEVTRLWVSILAWGCSSSDRRVRDSATKAMVRVSQHRPEVWHSILTDVLEISDEYILERVLLAAYGALIRNQCKDSITNASEVVWNDLFDAQPLTTNVAVRDAGRLILDLAAHFGVLPDAVDRGHYQPPYTSEWPLEFPDDTWISSYAHSSNRAVSRLHRSCTDDDFEKYTVNHALGNYSYPGFGKRGEITLRDACAWILSWVIEQGYADDAQLTDFDAFLMGKYGTGRAREPWAERVGKKYQWIALYKLLGHLHDNAQNNEEAVEEDISPSTLQGDSRRDIDPTILIREVPNESQSRWWYTDRYDFSDSADEPDDQWIDAHADFALSASRLTCKSPQGVEWVVLTSYLDQYSKVTHEYDEPYRQISLSMCGYLVGTDDAEKFWRWMRQQDLADDFEIHRHKELPSGAYIGEYPWAASLDEFHKQPEYDHYDIGLPCEVRPATYDKTIALRYDAAERDSVSVPLPSPLFFDFKPLSWDGVAGYYPEGATEKVLDCPFVENGGTKALIVRRSFLDNFLKTRKLTLFWTMYSQRMVLGGGLGNNGLGYVEKTMCNRYAESKVRSSKERTYRIKSGERVELAR
ncbi:MAG: hypothetical protein AAGB04_07600 [Pseudomonadota bacterium]